MYDFRKIKLIIWDLDDTFWEGTLSEGKINIIAENVQLVKNLTDLGIVNSICSKNDRKNVELVLKKTGIFDLFVFTSINWESKGPRVKRIIKDMNLRTENVLFLDDNHLNREEVKYFCSNIMVESPEGIQWLVKDVKIFGHSQDKSHSRLEQYRLLEKKTKEKESYSSNEKFLYSTNINVSIYSNCEDHIERIHDLVNRSNQLNFTKIRCSIDDLQLLFKQPNVQTGYVKVTDKFGDYGIVGFFAICDKSLIHFVFSCRTLGMGVEQYVYNYLKRPRLNICGEVVSDLSTTDLPKWINQESEQFSNTKINHINNLEEHVVLMKGPCDLFQIYPYIANTELFDTEFSYVSDFGIPVISSHSTHIVESLKFSKKQKALLDSEIPFFSSESFNDSIFKNNYRVVILSILTDANFGVYRRRGTGEKIACFEYLYPLTEPDNWDNYIKGVYNNSGFNFSEKILKDFSMKYEYIGRNTPEQIVENLNFIHEHLSKGCDLCIMLGGELHYEKNTNPAYEDRHIVHKRINEAIKGWAMKYDNVKVIDVNKYLRDQNSFYDHFNHYIKPVYYALAKEIVNIINEKLGTDIRESSRLKMVFIRLKEFFAPLYYSLTGRK